MNQFDAWVNHYAGRPPAAPQHPMMQQPPQYYQGPQPNYPGGPSDVPGLSGQGDGMLARGFQRPGMFSPVRQTDPAVVVRPLKFF